MAIPPVNYTPNPNDLPFFRDLFKTCAGYITNFFKALTQGDYTRARNLLKLIEGTFERNPQVRARFAQLLLTSARTAMGLLEGIGMLTAEAMELLTGAAAIGGGALTIALVLGAMAAMAMHSPAIAAEMPQERLAQARAMIEKMPDSPLHKARHVIKKNAHLQKCICNLEKQRAKGHQTALDLGPGFERGEMLAFVNIEPLRNRTPGGGQGAGRGNGRAPSPPRPDEVKLNCLYPLCRELMKSSGVS